MQSSLSLSPCIDLKGILFVLYVTIDGALGETGARIAKIKHVKD